MMQIEKVSEDYTVFTENEDTFFTLDSHTYFDHVGELEVVLGCNIQNFKLNPLTVKTLIRKLQDIQAMQEILGYE